MDRIYSNQLNSIDLYVEVKSVAIAQHSKFCWFVPLLSNNCSFIRLCTAEGLYNVTCKKSSHIPPVIISPSSTHKCSSHWISFNTCCWYTVWCTDLNVFKRFSPAARLQESRTAPWISRKSLFKRAARMSAVQARWHFKRLIDLLHGKYHLKSDKCFRSPN